MYLFLLWLIPRKPNLVHGLAKHVSPDLQRRVGVRLIYTLTLSWPPTEAATHQASVCEPMNLFASADADAMGGPVKPGHDEVDGARDGIEVP